MGAGNVRAALRARGHPRYRAETSPWARASAHGTSSASTQRMSLPRVLFVGEPATLAHVARPFALARDLARGSFDVTFATAPGYRPVLGAFGGRFEPLRAIGTREFLARTHRGRCVYSATDLSDYVDEDLRLLHAVRPDVVVGDFRLSLSVSARLAAIPYLGIVNAYWERRTGALPEVPAHALTRLLGVPLASRLFDVIAPWALVHHAQPMRRLRERYGLAPLPGDFREVVLDCDHRLYADPEALVPIAPLHEHETVLGPIPFSPVVDPDALEDVSSDGRPAVYVTLGSSGDARGVRAICEALDDLGCTVILSTAGAPPPPGLPATTRALRYVDGERAARLARFVVCNGGSPTTHQALRAGAPVLGVPANLDQLLCMFHVVERGVGLRIRADELSRARVRAMARRMLDDTRLTENARAMAGTMTGPPPARRLAEAIAKTLDSRRLRHASRERERHGTEELT